MTNTISVVHESAIIEGDVEIGEGVSIDAYAIIRGKVKIGSGTYIGPHAVIKGNTSIGKNNKIFQFASVGEDCQDKKYRGEETYLEIGDDNVIREFATLHRGTIQDKSLTKIGNRNLLMAYSHVGHDCQIGNDCILANGANLGGHVVLQNFVIIGGLSAIHQFCTVGEHAMLGGGSMLKKDVPAYVMIAGNPARARGINKIGLRRRGFSEERIKNILKAYKTLYNESLLLKDAIEEMERQQAITNDADIKTFLESIKSSRRGIIR